MDTPSASGASHFDVLLLGPFSLFRDGRPLDTSAWQRKVHSLFRLLLTATDRRRSRDDLVAILWPDTNGEAGSRNLRVVLHMLRKALGAGDIPTILSEWGWVALNPAHEWDCDLDRFEELAASSEQSIAGLEHAAGFYRGEPLADDRYDDWAIAVRARVQRIWRDLCLRLAERHRELGALETTIAWLDRTLDSDPLDEDAMRRLLVVLGQLNRRTEALRRYQNFAQRLKDELDASPAAETTEVVAELRAERESVKGTVLSAEPEISRPLPVIPRYSLSTTDRMVGREAPLGRILWTLPPMHTVAPRLIIVRAAAGMGKTRLLAEVAKRARSAGLLTLAGSAFEHEGVVRYGPIRDALADYVENQPEPLVRTQLEGLIGEISRILPEIPLRFELAPGYHNSSEDQRLSLFLAVTKTLERIAGATPLVLLLDNLQWADQSTLQLLHFVVRQTQHNRMLIVGAYREDQSTNAHAIGRLAVDTQLAGWASILELEALAPPDFHTLVEERLRNRCNPQLIGALYRQSGGNPLRAHELLADWEHDLRMQQVDGEWYLVPGRLSPGEGLGAALA